MHDTRDVEYNVQFTSTGRWFNVKKHVDRNGVVWMDIKAIESFEQILLEEGIWTPDV